MRPSFAPIVLYVLIFIFFDSKMENRRFWIKFPDFNVPIISACMHAFLIQWGCDMSCILFIEHEYMYVSRPVSFLAINKACVFFISYSCPIN